MKTGCKDRTDMNEKKVITIEQIGKVYELGKIGGTTMQQSVQSWWAKKRGKEDPNRRIGQRIQEDGKFQALDNITCTIYEGERVGIIGRNGAGKSTLLKLLSRVTAPTEGKICIRGKISSMLEVGTGFHGELTGRENIYLNGAILGMSEQEVDSKIQDIIEFSECEQFIDTPVKRYSSGMYVKLAFSVAAFLNADIFLMDEVLAVGDMTFQKKCLNKMKQISEDYNKTILYVSHNMQTIRELCDRCIVLDQGRVIHDGDVETGISLYMQDILEVKQLYEYPEHQERKFTTGSTVIRQIYLKQPVLGEQDQELIMEVNFQSVRNLSGVHLRFTVHDGDDMVVGTGMSHAFDLSEGQMETVRFTFYTDGLVEGEYSADLAVVEPLGEKQTRHAYIRRAMAFRIEKRQRIYQISWIPRNWGRIEFQNMEAKIVQDTQKNQKNRGCLDSKSTKF